MVADWCWGRVRRPPGGSNAQQNCDPEKDLARWRRARKEFQVESAGCARTLLIASCPIFAQRVPHSRCLLNICCKNAFLLLKSPGLVVQLWVQDHDIPQGSFNKFSFLLRSWGCEDHCPILVEHVPKLFSFHPTKIQYRGFFLYLHPFDVQRARPNPQVSQIEQSFEHRWAIAGWTAGRVPWLRPSIGRTALGYSKTAP